MTFFQWKKFHFFDLKKEVDDGAIAGHIQEDNVVTCVASGRGFICLGDLKGNVWKITSNQRELQIDNFQGWDGKIEELLLPKQSSYLIGLGLDGFVRCLKVWNLEKLDRDGHPELVRYDRLTRQGSQSEPVTVAVSENLQILAVGYDDGGVVLYRGDVTRDRGHKSKVLFEKGQSVSGLSIRTVETGTYLYIATTEEVFVYNITVRDREIKTVLDRKGCTRGLCVSPQNFNSDTHFVTGQQDGVYCYNPEGRGQAYAFEGKKRLIYWFRGYLTIISDEGLDKATITVFDVQNKFIAYMSPIKPVLAVASEWGSIFLITQEGKIHQLIEQDTQTKLDTLFKKNFYDVAIKIAKNQHYDEENLVDIFRQYGDYLYYKKGDQMGAIDQYIKTIGFLEPSYVIQKFLDAQKIHNLTAYLQALHVKGLASEDHTTLLLNCYTKLKDRNKLDEFILSKDGKDVDFDVDIAIKVCRQAGYTKHALALAEKHQKHDLFLKIVIENDADYKQALNYISSLSPLEAEAEMKNYGSIFIKNVPNEFTNALKMLILKLQETGINFNAEDYIHLFVNDQRAMVDFLDHLMRTAPPVNGSVYNTQLEYLLYAHKASKNTPEKVVGGMAALKGKMSPVIERRNQSPEPRKGGGAAGFMKRNSAKKDQDVSGVGGVGGAFGFMNKTKVSQDKEEDDSGLKGSFLGNQQGKYMKTYEQKIMDLLKDQSDKYNNDHALVLCQLNNFQPGLLYLYQKMEMYDQILKHYFSEGDMESGINTCRKFGGQSPQLWVTALQSIAEISTAEIPPQLFKEVLDNIEKYRLLSPLQVVSTLSTCPTATLGVVRDYLLRTFSAEDRAMDEDKRVIEQYKKESQEIRDKLDKMNNEVMKFQGSICDICKRPLELPTVHFLCGHDFHLHCFQSYSDSENDCPLCAAENKKILDILQSQDKGRSQHDQFHSQLEKAEDGFSIVAEYLGRGMFEGPKVVNDPIVRPEIEVRRPSREEYSSVQPQSEARMRMADRPRSIGMQGKRSSETEGRMRQNDRQASMSPIPESRIRAGEASQAGMRIPSNARMRLAESGVLERNSLSANMSPVARRTFQPSSASPRVPRREDIPAQNPFKEDNNNPFGSPDSNESLGNENPFKSSSPRRPMSRQGQGPSNPFGEDDYNEEMNPFAAE